MATLEQIMVGARVLAMAGPEPVRATGRLGKRAPTQFQGAGLYR